MNRLMYFLIALLIWLLVTWSVDIQNVTAGVIIAAMCTALFGTVFFEQAIQMLNPVRVLWFLYFIAVFVCYMVRANIDVAYRVLHLDVPIRPGIVKVTTKLTSEIGQTMLANAITLTPGTLTVDIIGESMYIHWINVTTDDPARQTEIIVSRFESILRKVFD